MIWRLVLRRVASFEEIQRYWSLGELLDANEALDVQDDADWLASKPKGRR